MSASREVILPVKDSPENKLYYLSICDEPLPIWRSAKGAEKIVEIHKYVNKCVGEKGYVLQ